MFFSKERWIEISKARGLEQVEVRLIQKIGKCPHQEGDVFIYVHPNCRPEGLCGVAAIALEPFVQRCSARVRSWESDNPNPPKADRIHCPSKKGTIWEIRRVKD